jgi:hypothetical protein
MSGPVTVSRIPQPSFPCKAVYKIANLLSPVTKYSLISSSLWNEIVQDLYLTYSVFKYINYLSQYPYPEYIQPAIDEFLNFPYQFTPYSFTPLLIAQKGIPLTADEFNKLIDAITELANKSNIKLKSQLNHVQRDQIVRSSQFSNIIYAVNQLLTFNHNQYFLLSCTGYEFSNLLSKQNTFLNVLIENLKYSITIPSNTYIKNFLIYQTSELIISYGSIANLVIKINFGGILLYNYSYINSVNIETDNDGMRFTGHTSANTITIQTENGGIFLYDDSYVNTLYVENNVAGIYLYNNAIIENLICKQNSGGVYVSGNAKIINNQCA